MTSGPTCTPATRESPATLESTRVPGQESTRFPSPE